MKRFKYLFVIVIAVMLSVSCSKDDNSNLNDSALVGTWGFTETEEVYDEEQVITFNSDFSGILVYSITFDGRTESVDYNLTWSTSGNKLTIEMNEEAETGNYSITGNKLTINNMENDYVEVYTKQ
jgi:hypothetical protein